jgi:K+-transporting ATPase KdpF subunit
LDPPFIWPRWYLYGFFMGARSRMGLRPVEGGCHGSVVYRPDRRAGGFDLGRHRSLRTAAGAAVTTLYWIALVITLGLFGYLLYAMLKAENF